MPPRLEAPKLADIRAAAERIAGHLHRTPLLPSQTLSELTGCQVFLKCENLQKTGSFKPRGGINRVATLTPEQLERGVITISAGNHAQGVAYAARALGVSAVIVMPESATASKVAAARSYGAECVLHGDVHAAFEKLDELVESRSLTLVHPFDDPLLIAGHGTVGLEIHQECPDVDVIACGVRRRRTHLGGRHGNQGADTRRADLRRRARGGGGDERGPGGRRARPPRTSRYDR